jgi:acid phosphatase family membrane protein YuiD
MPPVAMTVTYADTNGISLSKAWALSPAFIIGVIINIIITYTGVGTRKIKGRNLKKYRRTIAAMVTGVVKKARKNIREI